MQLQPTPRPEHVLRVSAKLITSSTILHLSVEELERAINQEQLENPAFEVEEQRVCLFCGTRMFGQSCTTCGHFAQPEHSMSEMPNSLELPVETAWSNAQQFYDFDNFGFAEFDRDDEFDPLASIAAGETLAEILLRQLETLIAPGDEPIAEQLVGNLNERGYLEIGAAAHIGAIGDWGTKFTRMFADPITGIKRAGNITSPGLYAGPWLFRQGWT